MNFRLTFGEAEKHEIVVTYSKSLRMLRILIDGQPVYRHCGLLPWRRRRAGEFRTAGPDVHFLVVQPPGLPAPAREPNGKAYRLWLDGKRVLNVSA